METYCQKILFLLETGITYYFLDFSAPNPARMETEAVFTRLLRAQVTQKEYRGMRIKMTPC